jgi:hypothetical protein
VFRLNDTIQAAVQGGTATLASYASELRGLDLRSRRDTASGRFLYEATRHLDLSVAISSTKRTGAQPWGASFGFSDATVVPVPLDRRTNDVTAAAEWSNPRGSARLAYDGSWFNNGIEALVWDNPLRFTDTTNANAYSTGLASSQGRMSLWPDSSAPQRERLGHAARCRTARGCSVTRRWARGCRTTRCCPYTINTAIAPIPLARETAEAKAVITSMNYRYTSRPHADHVRHRELPPLRLRQPDRTLRADQHRAPRRDAGPVARGGDRAVRAIRATSATWTCRRAASGTSPSAPATEWSATTAPTGTSRPPRTTSCAPRWTASRCHGARCVSSTTIRLRKGSGLDEQVFEEINEQQSLRQFDIANRSRDRVSAIVQYLPTPALGLSGTASLGRERRPDSAFGLQDNDVHSLAAGVDYTLTANAVASVSYGYDTYRTLQRSRQANPPPDPTFFDERRDWQTRMNEHVHTVQRQPRASARGAGDVAAVAYDGVRDRSRYLYELAPSSTLTPVQQLPEVSRRSACSASTCGTRCRAPRRGVGYRLDHFDTNDFALGPGIMDTALIPTFLNLQYQWRPYDVHTVYLRLAYAF